MLFESKSVLLYAGFFWLATHLFVLLYEEPHLKHVFGAGYDEYRAAVPRWLPRLRPWSPGEFA
jgi:protein-S-isoprenylcysteine O-methyltransferase Ste14